jgi:hypothetical protein
MLEAHHVYNLEARMSSCPKLLFALYVVPHITQQYAGEPNLAAPLLARSWIVLILVAFSA